MSYKRLVDAINELLDSSDQTLSPQMRDLAERYTASCREVNERLRRCEEYLSQGLVSEAIQLSEADPNLIDAAGTLDFERVDEFRDLLADHGFEEPPRLLVDIAQQLNESYGTHLGLEDLLRRHRRLALQRSPIKDRLHVLRQIHKADPGNWIWDTDIRTYEKARLEELTAEAKQLGESRDLAGIRSLSAEIRAKGWLETPAKSLVRSLEALEDSLSRRNVRAQLVDIEARLSDAYQAFDLEAGRREREQWNALIDAAGLPDNDPLWNKVSDTFRWLEEEDSRELDEQEFQTAVYQLEQGMDDNVARDELERLAHAVYRHDRGMPEALQARFHSRLEQHQLAAARKSRLLMVSIGSGVALVAGIIGFFIYQQSQQSKITRLVRSIDPLLEGRDWQSAQTQLAQFEQNSPGLATDPQVTEQKTRIEKVKGEEEARVRRFDRAIASATASPPEPPDNAAMKEAAENALSAAEKEKVAALLRRRQELARSEQDKRTKEFMKLSETIAVDLAVLEGVLPAQLAAAEQQTNFDQLRQKLRDLEGRYDGVGEQHREHGDSLREKMTRIEKSREDYLSQVRATDAISRALSTGNWNSYADRLRQFAKEFPNSPGADVLEQTSQEAPFWIAESEMEAILHPWLFRLTNLTGAEAQTRLAKCKEVLNNDTHVPGEAAIERYVQFLEAILSREVDGKINERLREFFRDPNLAQVWLLRTKEGKSYYIPGTKPTVGSFTTLQFLADFDGNRKSRSFRDSEVEEIVQAPQSQLADSASRHLLNLNDSNWERTLLQIVRETRRYQTMDSVLKANLLKILLEQLESGSYLLHEPLEAPLKRLNTGIDYSIAWMNPEVADGDTERRLAAQVLGDLPAIPATPTETDSIEPYVQQRRDEFSQAFRVDLGSDNRLLGWVKRRDDGEWEFIRLSSVELSNGDLVVINVADPAHPNWEKIGKVSGKTWTLDAKAEGLRDGRPVWLVPAK